MSFIFRCVIRRLKSDVLSQLPSKRREVQLQYFFVGKSRFIFSLQMIVLDPSLVKTKNNREMAEKAREVQRKGISKEEKRLQPNQSFFTIIRF